MAARAGLARMARDASRARRLAPDEGILVSTCNFLEGAALHLTGERAKARGPLERGGRGGAAAAPNAQALCLAQLALLMIDENDWESAASATARARSQLDVAGLGSYPSMRPGVRGLRPRASAPRHAARSPGETRVTPSGWWPG